jgi:hydroxypyruvate reductase
MIIQNYSVLAKDLDIAKGLQILTAGLESAMPQKELKKVFNSDTIQIGKKRIKLSHYDSIHLVAFGKAANSMTKTVNSIVKIKNGIVVVPKGTKSLIKNNKFKIFKSGHPIPNQTSVNAAKSILKFVNQRETGEIVIFLVSGGSSALLALPDGITLNDKIKITKQLLVSGATIQEMNCVRKHLSQIKGGRLVKDLKCDAISLVMSDVLGDDLSSIASGTTYFDNTKFSDALKIIKKYRLQNKIPKSALTRLRLGSSAKIPETPKKLKIPHKIILTNNDCIKSMKNKSKQLGISFKTVCISGDVAKATSRLISYIPKKKNSCIIFGGETTVKVKGKGKGGRNQELVLRILEKTQKTHQNLIISSLGTDGIDGNTKYAGAITKNIQAKLIEIKSYLKNNNSNSFFKKYGGLIKTGYTHTNLMDIGIILKLK